MARLLDPIRDFFAGEGPLKKHEFIRLQIVRRSRNEPAAAPAACNIDGDDLERGARWERSKSPLAFLYRLLRSIKRLESIWNDRFPGWRSGIAGFTILASTVLILNISALVWTATHLDEGHYATVAVGTYKNISNLSERVHLGTNILSAALLAGSNYCMQCLSSPTRAEADAAHARGSYLNIGVLSWRNVLASRKRRICLLLLLTLSSIGMHPVYDTSFIMTTALQKHTSALVTPGFRSGEDISLLNPRPSEYLQDPDPLTRTDLSTRSRYIQHIINTSDIGDASLWENITAIECAEPRVFQTERSTLLIVLNETVTPEDLLASHGGREPQMDPRLLPYDHYKYLHVLTFFLRTPLYHNVSPEGKDWTSTSRWHTRISYCLRRKMPGRSRLQIHLWLLLGTTSLNAIKLGCLLSTFKEQQGTPLVTTGDAISSFLKSRCVYSVDMCLLSQGELLRTLDKRRGDNGTDASITYKRFEPKRLQYYRSVSFSRWVVYISSLMLVLLFSVYQYNEQRKRIQSPVTDYSLNLLWKTGLEKLNENSIIESHLKPCLKYPLHNGEYAQCAHKYGGAYAMILAGLPKLCVSAIYLSLNNQLTLMVQLRDWARLASRRQALRVSTPEPASDQVSTYWLSLPYQYSIPLLLSSVSLSWLVSQTLCMLRFHTYDDIRINEVPDVDHQMGFSGIALIGFLIFGTIIFGLSVAIGFCKCSPGLPIGPSNSLIIAAACHPPERDRYAARKMVKWGAIPNGNNEDDANSTHHCTITSRRVEDPVEGRWYG